MAAVRPFRALRYDTGRAGALEDLVAPPYDVISPAKREELRQRSRHNVVRLTLPDSEEEAAATLAGWRGEGILVRDEEPAFWILQQEYVGPDGVARTRTGLVASLTAEPYANGTVLPHERTHRGPKEGRLRLLRATRTQLEPIFLLYRGAALAGVPERAPELAVEGARLWRLPPDDALADAFAERRLLIADGYHRYETAVAFHEQDRSPASAQMLVVLVAEDDPGLTIFPTHRVFAQRPPGIWPGEPTADPEDALALLASAPPDTAAFVQYMPRAATLVDGGRGELDVRLVDALGHEGLTYTPDWREAVRRVDEGEAAVAFLLRPPRLEDVWDAAERGETMPQKTTYFFPKLLSGLLLHPLE